MISGQVVRDEPKVKTIGVFPDSSYPPVTYPVAATAASKNQQAIRYLSFLRTADLIRRQVSVIVANVPVVGRIKAATSTIPIVFWGVVDPVQVGLPFGRGDVVGRWRAWRTDGCPRSRHDWRDRQREPPPALPALR